MPGHGGYGLGLGCVWDTRWGLGSSGENTAPSLPTPHWTEEETEAPTGVLTEPHSHQAASSPPRWGEPASPMPGAPGSPWGRVSEAGAGWRPGWDSTEATVLPGRAGGAGGLEAGR